MWSKIAAWWNNVPHWLKVLIVAFIGGTTGILEPALEQWFNSAPVHLCAGAQGWACFKIVALRAFKAGGLAVIALYVPSPLSATKSFVNFSESGYGIGDYGDGPYTSKTAGRLLRDTAVKQEP